jgi:hypothetical protein
MNSPTFKPQPARAACILQGIVRAIEAADQEADEVQAASDWLTLIQAATCHAHYLLTGENPGAEQGEEVAP